MNAKHTPGPWELHGRAVYTADKRKHWIENRDRRAVYVAQVRARHDSEIGCHVDDVEDNPVCEQEAEANARLISAAPELLAALESITQDYRQLLKEHLALTKEPGWNWGTMPADDADRAIAKAKGQS